MFTPSTAQNKTTVTATKDSTSYLESMYVGLCIGVPTAIALIIIIAILVELCRNIKKRKIQKALSVLPVRSFRASDFEDEPSEASSHENKSKEVQISNKVKYKRQQTKYETTPSPPKRLVPISRPMSTVFLNKESARKNENTFQKSETPVDAPVVETERMSKSENKLAEPLNWNNIASTTIVSGEGVKRKISESDLKKIVVPDLKSNQFFGAEVESQAKNAVPHVIRKMNCVDKVETGSLYVTNAGSRPIETNDRIDSPSASKLVGSGKDYKVLHDYSVVNVGDIEVKKGEVMKIVNKLETGWWRGVVGSRSGWIPKTYVEPLSEPSHGFTILTPPDGAIATKIHCNHTVVSSTPGDNQSEQPKKEAPPWSTARNAYLSRVNNVSSEKSFVESLQRKTSLFQSRNLADTIHEGTMEASMEYAKREETSEVKKNKKREVTFSVSIDDKASKNTEHLMAEYNRDLSDSLKGERTGIPKFARDNETDVEKVSNFTNSVKYIDSKSAVIDRILPNDSIETDERDAAKGVRPNENAMLARRLENEINDLRVVASQKIQTENGAAHSSSPTSIKVNFKLPIIGNVAGDDDGSAVEKNANSSKLLKVLMNFDAVLANNTTTSPSDAAATSDRNTDDGPVWEKDRYDSIRSRRNGDASIDHDTGRMEESVEPADITYKMPTFPPPPLNQCILSTNIASENPDAFSHLHLCMLPPIVSKVPASFSPPNMGTESTIAQQIPAHHFPLNSSNQSTMAAKIASEISSYFFLSKQPIKSETPASPCPLNLCTRPTRASEIHASFHPSNPCTETTTSFNVKTMDVGEEQVKRRRDSKVVVFNKSNAFKRYSTPIAYLSEFKLFNEAKAREEKAERSHSLRYPEIYIDDRDLDLKKLLSCYNQERNYNAAARLTADSQNPKVERLKSTVKDSASIIVEEVSERDNRITFLRNKNIAKSRININLAAIDYDKRSNDIELISQDRRNRNNYISTHVTSEGEDGQNKWSENNLEDRRYVNSIHLRVTEGESVA